MKSLDIDDTFEDYMRKVNPSVEQHSVQYRESRRCFFAGMWLAMQHMLQVAEELSENKAMIEIAQQLKQFRDRVKKDAD